MSKGGEKRLTRGRKAGLSEKEEETRALYLDSRIQRGAFVVNEVLS